MLRRAEKLKTSNWPQTQGHVIILTPHIASGGGLMGRRKRRRVDPTDDWTQLELLCIHDEQVEYERIRPLVLFGEVVLQRAKQTGMSERTLYRKVRAFRDEGMQSLFGVTQGQAPGSTPVCSPIRSST